MTPLSASTALLIRKPPGAVFDAFADPRTLERFWLRRASGPLAPGAVVEWDFLVEGARETVTVTEFVPHERIAFTWSDGVSVTVVFEPFRDVGTRLSIKATGFDGDDAASKAIDATEGFTLVAADLKCLLETGRPANLVADKAALISAKRASEA